MSSVTETITSALGKQGEMLFVVFRSRRKNDTFGQARDKPGHSNDAPWDEAGAACCET
jgi:hypothetical protein